MTNVSKCEVAIRLEFSIAVLSAQGDENDKGLAQIMRIGLEAWRRDDAGEVMKRIRAGKPIGDTALMAEK
jgi:hypothetical protein